MKTLAYYPIHYGSEYLAYSMQSIRQSVDHIIVLYSSNPTYGHSGNIPNPDTKQDILSICQQFNAELFDLTNHNISRENKHRQMAFQYAKGYNADILVAVDYDEVWENLDGAIQQAAQQPAFELQIRHNSWNHFWKTFNEINKDGFQPVRIFNLNGDRSIKGLVDHGTIHHFGYAISPELMQYKISCHGHKSEIPKNWYKEKWLNYKKGETTHLHPASQTVWIETEKFNKTKLPHFMRKHPLYEK